MAALLSTFTDVGLVNTTTNAGTITLPLTTQIPYRQIIFKDAYGNLSNKSLTLSTQGGETFEDGSSRKAFQDSFGFQTVYGYNGKWYFLGGTAQNATTISSLTVSSINGGIPVRTSDLVSTTQGLETYISTFIDSGELASTIVSSVAGIAITSNLRSTVEGLGSSGYISSLSLTSSLISTTNFISLSFSSFSTAFGPGGGINTENLISSVEGLGTAGYISSASLASSLISTINFVSLSFSSFSTAFGPGGGINTSNLISTVEGLGSSRYLSSFEMIHASSITASNVSSTYVVGDSVIAQFYLQVLDGVLAVQNQSGFLPYTAAFLTSNQDVNLLYGINDTELWRQSIKNLAGNPMGFLYDETTEILTLDGQNRRVGVYNSTPMYTLDISGDAFVSSLKLSSLQMIDTFTQQLNYLTTSSGILLLNGAAITGGGAGGAGVAQLIAGTNISLSPAGGTGVVTVNATAATPVQLLSTVEGLGTTGYISTGGQGYFSSVTINMLPQDAPFWDSNAPVAGFDPEPNPLALDVFGSARILKNIYIGSTTTVIGTGAIITPSMNTTLISTATTVISSLGFVNSESEVPLYLEMSNGKLVFNGNELVTANEIDSVNLLSTVEGLGSAGYISSASLTSSLISTIDFVSLSFSSFSTAFGPGGGINTENLISSVEGLGTAGYISSASLASSLISTTNFVSLSFSSFSTAFGPGGGINTSNLTSTVGGLGQIYLSSIRSVLSTTQFFTSSAVISTGTFNTVSTLTLNASSINAFTMNSFRISTGSFTASSINILTANVSTTATISSLIVNSLQFGDGTGWVNLGPIETVALSSLQINTNTLYANNSLFGNTSTATALQFYGLFGNYNNTVLAEVSTGAGTQEFLVFKGSSSSDRVRVQTTGNFVIETGVSARLFNSNTTQTLSNATPAFIINSSSNVGIQTATPGATLDVAGAGRFVTLSSLALFASSIVAPYIFEPQFFTF